MVYMIPYYLTLALGHSASECKANRVFDISNVPEMDAEAAWNALQAADEERELDDFRTVGNTYNPVITCANTALQAFKVYCKAVGNVTYEELERSFRLQNFNVHLIATVCRLRFEFSTY